jgi:cation-transporting ATPase 13A1
LKVYATSTGIADGAVAAQRERYGGNVLAIEVPGFFTLLANRLISPVAAFQFFTIALSMLDGYLSRSAFALFVIAMCEWTSVNHQRATIRELNRSTLKPHPVKVYREGKVQHVRSDELLPADLVWLVRHRRRNDGPSNTSFAEHVPKSGRNTVEAAAASPVGDFTTEVVPCDCVVLFGRAVVNEATLTGESVPQMKDALVTTTPEREQSCRRLDVTAADRTHTLFSGTTLVSTISTQQRQPHYGSSSAANADGVADSGGIGSGRSVHEAIALLVGADGDDDGCLCFVLRTGFNSSQGEPVTHAAFSQHLDNQMYHVIP